MKTNKYPKTPPPLTSQQQKAKEEFMMLWHQELPNKYQLIENFNHKYIAKLPLRAGSKTLEVGAGLGAHAKFEDLTNQEYYCLEYREAFCTKLKQQFANTHVIHGDIQEKQQFPDGFFDRIIAVHVLEHLPLLPSALNEIHRLLKKDGFFDIVLPCEGGLAYSLARKISAQRLFEKTFCMDYDPIIKNEHLSTFREIINELTKLFKISKQRFFPCYLPLANLNLVVGLRLSKKG